MPRIILVHEWHQSAAQRKALPLRYSQAPRLCGPTVETKLFGTDGQHGEP